MRRTMQLRVVVAMLAALGSVLAACGSDGADETAGTTTSEPTSGTTSPTVGTSVDCAEDEAEVLGIVDGWMADAGLAPGTWVDPATETPFDDRTYPPAEFADYVGMPCDLRAVQVTDGGDVRLVLATWVLPRYGFVVQATDGRAEPYAPLVMFELLLEQTRGEWIDEQNVWAATMEGGETILIGVEDFAPGAVAKSWQSAFPPLPDADVTLPAEQLGIAVLEGIGATNVGVAQPPEYGSEVGTVMAVTATGQIVVAYVGPPDEVAIENPWLSGESTTREIDDVTVYVTLPGEGQTDVADVRFACGELDFRLASSYGTPEELIGVAEDLIAHIDCDKGIQDASDVVTS